MIFHPLKWGFTGIKWGFTGIKWGLTGIKWGLTGELNGDLREVCVMSFGSAFLG